MPPLESSGNGGFSRELNPFHIQGRFGMALVYPWFRAARTLVFPEACLACGGAIETEPMCSTCSEEFQKCLGPQCVRCAVPWNSVQSGFAENTPCPDCRKRPQKFDAAIAIGAYDGPLRMLCLQLKSRRGGWLAPRMVDLLLSQKSGEIEGWIGDHCQRPSPLLMVPVPLHWGRRWGRGFNQADSLARVLGQRLGISVCDALRRTKVTPRLHRLSKSERKSRLRNAIGTRWWFRSRLKGRDVILVDDILTTGATCSAAAQALKRAGARHVYVLVLARARDPR